MMDGVLYITGNNNFALGGRRAHRPPDLALSPAAARRA